MELFKQLAEMLGNTTLTLVVKKTEGGKMNVCVSFNNKEGGITDDLPPLFLKGTPEELDEKFFETIKEPAETVNDLVTNVSAFVAAAKKAKENAMKSNAVKKPVSTSVKPATENKEKEAEEKAKKELFEKVMKLADENCENDRYYTANKLYQKAASLTDDKKKLSEIEKKIEETETNKTSFLCEDSEEEALETMKQFESEKPQEAEKKEDEDADQDKNSEKEESEEEESSEENTENEE